MTSGFTGSTLSASRWTARSDAAEAPDRCIDVTCDESSCRHVVAGRVRRAEANEGGEMPREERYVGAPDANVLCVVREYESLHQGWRNRIQAGDRTQFERQISIR